MSKADTQLAIQFLQQFAGLQNAAQATPLSMDGKIEFDFGYTVEAAPVVKKLTQTLGCRADRYSDHHGTQYAWDFAPKKRVWVNDRFGEVSVGFVDFGS